MKKGFKKLVVRLAVIASLLGIAAEVGAQTVSACCWWRPCRPCYPTYTYVTPKPAPKPTPVTPKEIEAPTVYTLVSGSNRISGEGLPEHYIGLIVETKTGERTDYPAAYKIDSTGNFSFLVNHTFEIGDKISVYQYLGTPNKKTEMSETILLGIYTF